MVSKTFFQFLFFLSILFFSPGSVFAQHSKQSYKELAQEVLHYVNEHREKIGLRALAMNEIISEAAEKHSHDMATGRVPFGHEGFDARMGRLRKKLQPVNAWAENVAAGDETAREVVEMWLQSPGHKKNIEGNYNLTGIGIVSSRDGQLYFTQIFINKRN